MTQGLLAALVAVNLAYIVYLHLSGERAARERAADREERQTLLQRIQAPQLAAIEHAQRETAEDDPMPTFDDHELTDEEQEAIERLERLEAESAPWLA